MDSEYIAKSVNFKQEEIAELQRKLIVDCLPDIINNTPRYTEFGYLLNELSEENAIETLKKLPLTSKYDVLVNPELFHRTDLQEHKYDVRTGGTSGEILSFSRIRSEYDVEKKHVSYCWTIMGIELGKDKGVILNARPPKNSLDGFSHLDRNNMLWIGCDSQTNDHWLKIFKAIDDFQPAYIRGYGSLVSEFFKKLDSMNLVMPPSIKAVAYSSDPILRNELEFIQENYCDNVISLYGQTERVVMGVSCEKGSDFHLLPTYGFTEIIREDGTPVEQPGEIGEIVSTSLYPRLCSFVRYLTGDLGSWTEGKCKCGNEGPTISQFVQRSHEKVVNKFGEEINIGRRNSFLDFRDSLPIGVGVQFKQNVLGELHVYIQSTDKKSEKFENALQHLETEFVVSHEFVDAPILNPNGKRTLLIK